MISVTPFYAALAGLMFFLLSLRTLRLRRKLGVAIGDGGNREMLRAIRVHANFAEYVPFTLLLILMLELSGASAPWLHMLGACLILGRISHAHGVSKTSEDFKFRVLGMGLTFSALVGSSAMLLAMHLIRLTA